MNRGKALFVILMVVCATAMQTTSARAESFAPLLNVLAQDVYLTAGEENTMKISLNNVGSFGVYEVRATLSVPTTTLGISIISDAFVVFNKIEEGQTRTYHPVVYVDRLTPLGAYSLTYQISYTRIGEPQYMTATVQIGIVVDRVSVPKLGLDVRMEELKISAGTDDEALIRISNIGYEPVYKLDVRVISTSPQLVVMEAGRFTHERLDPDGGIVFNTTLAVSRSAPMGVYTLTVSVTYEDGEGRKYSENFAQGLTVDSVKVTNQTTVVLRGYTTDPETIKPGNIVDITLDLACLGARAYEVKAILSLDPLTGISILSPTLVALGGLNPGESTNVAYKLIVGGSTRAGQYPATVTLTYIDGDGVPRSLMERVTLIVRGIVEFSILNNSPIVVEAGGITEFEADLLLVGTEGVRFVAVELLEDANFNRTTKSWEYLGAIDPDSPTPFSLEFEVDGGTLPGGHTMSLNVTYTDDLNQKHDKVLGLPVTVVESTAQKPSQGTTGGFWVWLRRLFGLTP
jgi:hypothetical protein